MDFLAYLVAASLHGHAPRALPLPEQGQIIEVAGQGSKARWLRGISSTSTDDCPLGDCGGPIGGNPSANAGAALPVSYTLGAECTGGCTVRYVVAGGAGSAPCTSNVTPCATITAANNAASAGDLIAVHDTGGTYHLGRQWTEGTGTWSSEQFITKNNIKLYAYPGESPVFDGVSNYTAHTWTASGSNDYTSYEERPCTTGSGITFCTGQNVNGGATGAGTRPDQIWIDGVEQQQVMTLGAPLTSGTFYVDTALDRLYVNHAQRAGAALVEVSDIGVVLTVSGSGVTIKGIKFKRQANTAVHGGVVTVSNTADNFAMDNVEIDDSAMMALLLNGTQANLLTGVTLTDLTISQANWMGLSSVSVKDLVVDGLYCTYMDFWDEYASSPQNGCYKGSRNYNPTIKNSYFANNKSQGIWCDESCYNFTFANNTVVNTGTSGEDSCVFFEISDLFYAINNYISCPIKNGLKMAGSSGLNIIGNTIIGGTDGIGIYADDRSFPGCATTGTASAKGYRIYTGTIAVTNGSAAVVGTGTKFTQEIGASDYILDTDTGQLRQVNGSGPSDDTHLTVTANFTITDASSGATADTNTASHNSCGSTLVSNNWVASSPSRPATMTWMPSIDLIMNNVIVNPTGTLYCGSSRRAGICIQRTYGTTVPSRPLGGATGIIHTIDVANSRPQTVIDCNAFRVDSGDAWRIGDPSSKTTYQGYLTPALFATGMAAASPYPAIANLDANGLSLTSTNVSTTGVITETGGVAHSNACATPTDATINAYIAANVHHYGVSWQ